MESFFAKLSIMLAPALMAITCHEVSHGVIADHFGDPTARLSGRLSLNPLRHLDPIGTISLMVFGFGWARPVPVVFSNLRHPRRDMIWVSLAGPGANFTLAILCSLLLHVLAYLFPDPSSLLYARLYEPLALMLGFGLYINLLLGLFNLLPIPPPRRGTRSDRTASPTVRTTVGQPRTVRIHFGSASGFFHRSLG